MIHHHEFARVDSRKCAAYMRLRIISSSTQNRDIAIRLDACNNYRREHNLAE